MAWRTSRPLTFQAGRDTTTIPAGTPAEAIAARDMPQEIRRAWDAYRGQKRFTEEGVERPDRPVAVMLGGGIRFLIPREHLQYVKD